MNETTPAPAPKSERGSYLSVFAITLSLLAIGVTGVVLEQSRTQRQQDTSTADTQAKALQTEIAELKDALASAQGEINTLHQNLASQASTEDRSAEFAASLDAAKAELQTKQDALAQDIAKLSGKLEGSTTPDTLTELRLSYLLLDERVQRGEPYRKELARWHKARGDVAADKAAIATLEKHQDEGIALLSELYNDLTSVTVAAPEAYHEPEVKPSGSWWQQTLASMRGLIKVERIGEDSSPFATLEDVQTLMKFGDVQQAREAILRLPEQDQRAFEAWLDASEARLNVLEAIASLAPETPAYTVPPAPAAEPAKEPEEEPSSSVQG